MSKNKYKKMNQTVPIIIATRGSPLAMTQSNMILAECRRAFPDRNFELKIVKTTGDRLQTSNFIPPGTTISKGLFTKELEVALLNGEADMAVHSLKDLPTDLPSGLMLGAVSRREDVRDVLIYHKDNLVGADSSPGHFLDFIPPGGVVGTCSTRRKAQLLELRPDLKIIEHRGNVLTRITKLDENRGIFATVLAAAGLNRLGYTFDEGGPIRGERVPEGICGRYMNSGIILPCVGQAALAIEVRVEDSVIAEVCKFLNHPETESCVTAERSFLARMGGGCQSPVACLGEIRGGELHVAACNFDCNPPVRAEVSGAPSQAVALGEQLAAMVRRS